MDAAQLEGTYTSLGNYPDADMMKLVTAASSALNRPGDHVLRWFGRHPLPLLADRYPQFFRPFTATRPFLLTLNDIIHPEVRKLYPGAGVPVFDFDASAPDTLAMGYTSARRFCAFAEGLIEGAAAHYGEEVAIEQPTCMNRGDKTCTLMIRFKKRKA